MPNSHSLWTKQEDKSFENAIATHFQSHIEPTNQRWAAVAAAVPTRTMQELKQHFELLVEDVRAIDAGHVAIPSYMRDNDGGKEEDENYGSGVKSESGEGVRRGVGGGGMKAEVERKKGIPWTEEEHRLFLLGLDKFGKGDWRSISRNFVITRTPTQVASHAQKYFIRLNSMNKDRRRSSIHDITNVDSGGVSNQAPITGQPNNNMNPTGAVTPTVAKQRTSQSSVTPALAMYGTQMGHPITAAPPPHMAPAVGTPYMVPPSHHHPSHYPVPMAYPVTPPPVHR